MIYIHGGLISEMIRIDEEILDTMQSILCLDENEKETEKILYDYLRMYLKREERLISKFPNDESFISYLISNINGIVANGVNNPDNAGRIISRFSTFLNCSYLKTKPDEDYSTVLIDDKLVQYDLVKERNEKLISFNYNKNLIIKYLKYLEDLKMLGIYDESELVGVQFLNMFLYGDINNELSKKDFDVYKLRTYSDDEFMVKNNISKDEFLEMKQDVIFSNISILLKILFNKNNNNIDHCDAEYNFKFLLSELSYDNLIMLSDNVDGLMEEFSKNADDDGINLLCRLTTYIEKELDRKSKENQDFKYENMTDQEYVKLINLVNFEKKYLDVFGKFSFDISNSSDLDLLNKMQELEDDLVKNINFDDITISDFAVFLTDELSELLTDEEYVIIQTRLRFLFPEYSSLFISPSQSPISYELLFRNYIVDTLREFYDVSTYLEDNSTFMSFYKDRFFMYPFLTKELLSFNGNHLMIESTTDETLMEIADIDEIEYGYDVNNQYFKEICSIVDEFSNIDSSFFDSAYFQYKLIQFDYISRLIGIDKLSELGIYIDNSNIEFKRLLLEIVSNNMLEKDYDFELSYTNDGINIKVINRD